MTDALDDPTAAVTPVAAPPETPWQPLPRRGATLYALAAAFGFAVPAGVAVGVLASALTRQPAIVAALLAAAVGLVLGAGLGLLRHRRIGWKLDDEGFAVRRGGLWRSETLVPASRVQHLDLERGPLERQLGLATLVVHTAGTRMAAVKLPLLALADAEALRAHLARQVETDDAL